MSSNGVAISHATNTTRENCSVVFVTKAIKTKERKCYVSLSSESSRNHVCCEFGNYYVVGLCLMVVGCALEWYAYCDWHIELLEQGQSWFLMGMMVFASLLVTVFLTRPICPKGDLVRMVGVIGTALGSVFTALAMTGVYYDEFKLFLNIPIGIAVLFVATVFYGAWQIKRAASKNTPQLELPGAMATMGLVLILVLLSEQIYMYWYCRNQYGQTVSNWQSITFLYMFIAWAVSGVAMLLIGILFKKQVLRALAAIASALSVFGIFMHLPLHSNGVFQFVFNLSFMTWICVSVSLLVGHGLWRFMTESNDKNEPAASQLYYAVGLILLAIGCGFEWYAHCRWQIDLRAVGDSNFWLGVVVLFGLLILSFLARPLPPRGLMAQCVGTLMALAGAVWTAWVMTEVYYDIFTIFANVPFLIATAFVASILLSGASI